MTVRSETLNPDPTLVSNMRQFVLGLIAGEGSFFVTVSKDQRVDRGFTCTPRFSMNMDECDEALLREIQSRIGVGSVDRDDQRDTAQWRLGGQENCAALIEWIGDDFDMFRHSDKHDKYVQWRKVIEEIYSDQTDWQWVAVATSELNNSPRGRGREELIDLMTR